MSKGSKFRSGTDLQTVAENIQTLTGQRGNGLDRAVTARELADLGLASKRVGTSGQVSLIPGVTPPPGWGGPGANKPVQYPTRSTGFTAYGAFSFIALVWDMPKYGGHTLTEVYRNSEDNLANAVLVGTEAAGVYSDPQNTGQPGAYYWIRHVNANGVPGPYNNSKGTFAKTDPNAAQNLIADRVVAGIEIITPLIRSARIENGRFTVDENGNVVATNASMNFMTANGGWFYDIYAERATFRNTLISEDCDVRGTIYANRLVGDVYNAQSGGIHIPTATPSSPWAGYFSWSSTAGEHVIWDIAGEDFDRVMDTNVTIKAGSSYRQYFTLLLRSPGHDDIEIVYKDTGNDGGGMEYIIQGVRLPAVGRDKSQQLIMRIGENRNGFVTIFTPVISGGGTTGSPEVRAASVISVYRAGRQIATSGPA